MSGRTPQWRPPPADDEDEDMLDPSSPIFQSLIAAGANSPQFRAPSYSPSAVTAVAPVPSRQQSPAQGIRDRAISIGSSRHSSPRGGAMLIDSSRHSSPVVRDRAVSIGSSRASTSPLPSPVIPLQVPPLQNPRIFTGPPTREEAAYIAHAAVARRLRNPDDPAQLAIYAYQNGSIETPRDIWSQEHGIRIVQNLNNDQLTAAARYYRLPADTIPRRSPWAPQLETRQSPNLRNVSPYQSPPPPQLPPAGLSPLFSIEEEEDDLRGQLRPWRGSTFGQPSEPLSVTGYTFTVPPGRPASQMTATGLQVPTAPPAIRGTGTAGRLSRATAGRLTRPTAPPASRSAGTAVSGGKLTKPTNRPFGELKRDQRSGHWSVPPDTPEPEVAVRNAPRGRAGWTPVRSNRSGRSDRGDRGGRGRGRNASDNPVPPASAAPLLLPRAPPQYVPPGLRPLAPAAPATMAPPPPPGPVQRPPVVPPAPSRGARVITRRPTAAGMYYSSQVPPTDAQFEDERVVQQAKRNRLSHVGRIEETSAGMPRLGGSCGPCRRDGIVCKVYTDAGRQQYHGKPNTPGARTCAYCVFRQRPAECH
ncbi:hypothetical protein CERZMDRAFT_101379 [Cercospora zeae-maydis SCOH1-5]|uniref:Uncharacterized protein n=1 Tax=Cercospora zeae-maydis SCOH1-5 TaxID=717836 RepID=A0A6A6F510_9PEZI|nr:hypothetical protein CERZMDRAFT_101379 [Cercospora zeae-maydis SCOH1-5]